MHPATHPNWVKVRIDGKGQEYGGADLEWIVLNFED
jgi:hypothetical protein